MVLSIQLNAQHDGIMQRERRQQMFSKHALLRVMETAQLTMMSPNRGPAEPSSLSLCTTWQQAMGGSRGTNVRLEDLVALDPRAATCAGALVKERNTVVWLKWLRSSCRP